MKENKGILEIMEDSATLDKSAFLKDGWYFSGSFVNKKDLHSMIDKMNFTQENQRFVIIQREIPFNVTTYPNLSKKAVFKNVLVNALFTKNCIIPTETIQMYGGMI
jgi:hypothetical protein